MGSTDSDKLAKAVEKPAHPVTLKGFWMDETEVTNAQFEKLILDHNRQKPGLLLVTLCLFHYTDQHEYEGISE